jgi:O-antigen ligase
VNTWLPVAIGFSIPISTSLSEVLTTAFIVTWLAQGGFEQRLRLLRGQPVIWASLALFGFLLLGVTWSSATTFEALRCLLKYRELLYIPMFATASRKPEMRLAAMRGFMLGCLMVLGLSYFEWLTGVDLGMESAPNDFVIGKDRIIHSILMALLLYLAALEFARQPKAERWLFAGLAALAGANILFLIQGRTGYLLLGALGVLWAWQQYGRRGLAWGLCAAVVLGIGAYAASATLRARVAQTVTQVKNQFGPQRLPSWDARLEFYENTLTLIGRHPLAGTGTGSFAREYGQVAKARSLRATSDPHNEYLLLAAQLGLGGALLYLAVLVIQWRAAARLPEWESRLARGAVLALALGSLFNSLLLSVTGGLIYSYFTGVALGAAGAIDDAA